MENCLVSIIIPVYNAERYLNKSVKSVLSQSYNNIELLLIDDCSTDKSGDLCDQLALTEKSIKVLHQKNQGPAAARNTGIKNAHGEFIYFLDADDYIKKYTIQTLVNSYNKTHAKIVMSNFNKLENNGKIIKQNVTFKPNSKPFNGKFIELSKKEIEEFVRYFLKSPSNHLISYCWARLYSLPTIKKYNLHFNESMRLFEDFVFNLEYLKHVNSMIFINNDLYTYQMHNDCATASMGIINGKNLLHDMQIFKNKVNEFFQLLQIEHTANINKEIGHALVHYAIIFMIRTCRFVTYKNMKTIHDEFKKVLNSKIFKESLKYYSTLPGNSKIMPLLMKHKLIYPMMYFGRYKAFKRYGKLDKHV